MARDEDAGLDAAAAAARGARIACLTIRERDIVVMGDGRT